MKFFIFHCLTFKFLEVHTICGHFDIFEAFKILHYILKVKISLTLRALSLEFIIFHVAIRYELFAQEFFLCLCSSWTPVSGLRCTYFRTYARINSSPYSSPGSSWPSQTTITDFQFSEHYISFIEQPPHYNSANAHERQK